MTPPSYAKPRPAVTRVRSPRRLASIGARHVLLFGGAAVAFFPVLLVVSTAFKQRDDYRNDPFSLFTSFTLDNFATAWVDGRFGSYVATSLSLSIPATLLVVVLSTAGGYAFARLPFPGRSLCFYLVVLGLLVPFFAYMIPLYYELRQIGLLDTIPGLVLVLTSGGCAFGTFFMKSFFSELPIELEQAARVDGANEFQIALQIMLPMVRSGIAALAVFTFLGSWNNFLVPLLYAPSGRFQPLTTGLYSFAAGKSTDVGPLAAGALITILPVLALFVGMQRQVTEGFAGAVKG